MTSRPRRIPPTPQQRANRILTQTRGAHSAQGAVPAARPVTATSRARTYNPQASVITGNSSGIDATSISSTLPGLGASSASGDGAVAVGTDLAGNGAYAAGDESTAVGGNASVTHNYGGAIGAHTFAGGIGTWAIGTDSSGAGAAESTADVIKLGTTMHTTVITGHLVISDGISKWRLDPTGGTLSLVAYP